MRLALLVLVWLLGAAVVAGAAEQSGAMTVELLAVDTAESEPPLGAATAKATQGADVQLVLPFREQGSWLRITPASLPPEPRLVVSGVAVGRMVLVLPGGRRVERAKTSPSTDPVASAVAAVFALPADLTGGTPLWLYVSDHHRNLVDLHLVSAAEWRERERVVIAFNLAVYGALGAFVIIAATYYAILRERVFADHALYLVSLLVFMTMSSGLFYVPFHDGLWSRLGIQAQWGFATLAIGFAVGFANRFIDVGRRLPRLARALEVVRLGFIAAGVAVMFTPFPSPYFAATVAIAIVAINFTMAGLGVYVAAKDNRYARYFLLGWIPLTIGTTARAIQGTGLMELPHEIASYYALGALWEALVLTAGIADRALNFRRERDLAQHLGEHDGLTGALNRITTQARLDEMFKRARGTAAPLALFFLDLDRFKSINDSYGHGAGDAVLVAIAGRIAAQLRSGDVLGRWGGEEFVAILPGAPPDVARAIGERIRRAIEAEPVHADTQLIPVTVSVGLAMLGEKSERSADLVQRADEALYRAKGMGRNRVEEAPLLA